MSRVLLLFLSCLILAACGPSSSEQKTSDSSGTTGGLLPEAGKLHRALPNQINPAHTFSLYLPKGWQADSLHPAICFFDAHARGAYPLELYRDIADEYGYILAGSHQSRNGLPLPEQEQIAGPLMVDLQNRFGADPRQIFVAGFSGGARVATHLATADPSIAGVIACGAGFPAPPKEATHFPWIGLVGSEDFNLLEMLNIDAILTKTGSRHYLHLFGGEHEWPKSKEMETAFLWLRLQSIAGGGHVNQPELIEVREKEYRTQYEQLKSSGQLVPAFNLARQALALFGLAPGVVDVKYWETEIQVLRQATEIKDWQAKFDGKLRSEQQAQTQYQQALPVEQLSYWEQELATLQQSTKTDSLENQKRARLLNYLGLMGYMYANSAIQQGDADAADHYLAFYRLVDPENPEAYYLSAAHRMREEKVGEAVDFLKEAVALGFSEAKRFKTDPVFKTLEGDPVYGEIWEGMARNR